MTPQPQHQGMRVVVEVGGWEHECCGPAYEREQVVALTCLVVPGRVAEVGVEHRDGTVEDVQRLPSGRALRGFDDEDDGHLEQPWTGDPVVPDADRYLITIVS
ncbi:hypothetical protein GCM10009616_21450 [Microlunatus lacustris]